MGNHQSAVMKTDQWFTPREIMNVLGDFDLDPCSPKNRPYDTARVHYTIDDNGLIQPWFGQVWLNPPYGRYIDSWMKRMSEHGLGVSLVFARTDTIWFQEFVFPVADSILFLKGRLNFLHAGGIKSMQNAGAPSLLIGYGEENVNRLNDSGLKGRHVLLNSAPIVIVGISPTWKCVVKIALNRMDGEACLKSIYELVEIIAPDKLAYNPYYKEKIRQTLQKYFTRVKKGIYSIPIK